MIASVSDAYLLVTHGSRDPRPAIAAKRLTQALAQRTPYPIEAAALEFADCPLHQQILAFAARLPASSRLHVVPLFLLAGVHVREDVPSEVELAQQQANISLHLTPPLGRSPLMGAILEQLFQAADPRAARVLLSHGSRRANSTQDARALADQLDARLAFWSTAPQLAEQVDYFVQAGQRSITVLPYFLFPGGITAAIAQQVVALRQTYPSATIITAPVLSESERFEAIVADLMGLKPNPTNPLYA